MKNRQTKKAAEANAKLGQDASQCKVPLRVCSQSGLVMRDVVANRNRDLVIEFQEKEGEPKLHYIVSSAILRKTSSYFRTLFDPTKFKEGVSIDHKMQKLLDEHGDLGSVPLDGLPRIELSDAGQQPGNIKLETAMTCLLSLLHQPHWHYGSQLNLQTWTMVVIMADRFDCIGPVKDYISRENCLSRHLDINTTDRWNINWETRIRQILLVSLLLKIEHPRFKHHSAKLILTGSQRWNTDAVDAPDMDALWWNLPSNLEEELASRREYLLETIGSIHEYLLKLYIYDPNQCRLGYDTSPACNSFQLGEAVRFFARKGMLSLQNSVYSQEQDTKMWQGRVEDLISTLRQCPSYQLDSNHMHCGPRNRLIVALDYIQPFPVVGVCSHCWLEDAHKESWLKNPAGGKWTVKLNRCSPSIESHGCNSHREAKAMFTADERIWVRLT